MTADARAALAAAPLLRDALPETLDRAAAAAEPLTVPAGEVLVAEGGRGMAVFMIVDGELSVTKRTGGRDVSLSMCGLGEFVGELSVLQDLPHSATVKAVRDSSLVRLPAVAFLSLLDDPHVARRLLQVVALRLANTQAQLQQSEKLAALGTIAAGLAHELNNPAAALARGTGQLAALLARWQALTVALASQAPDDLGRLGGRLAALVREPAALDPLARSDAEEALGEWLEARGVEPAWDLAGNLAALGLDAAGLEAMLDGAPGDAAAWIATGAALHELTRQAREAAARISALVADVKGHSHLDQAPHGPVRLHEELERTVALLRHKLPATVSVVRDFAPDLPAVDAHAAQLNQVWTNLLDNAIDAVGARGTITLRTRAADGEVTVEVADDGPGIPEAVRERVFEPFVTTKPVGAGTGLGLYLAYDIVTRGHGGSLDVESGPYGTTFRVRLPAP